MADDDTLDSAGTADTTTQAGKSIVVGHDGSAGARNALTVALQLATDLGSPVTIVRAWSLSTAPRPKSWKFGYVCSNDELAEAVQEALVAETSDLLARFASVPVEFRVLHAAPAESLIRCSQTARMLVVGSRGRGGFSQLALGSVSEQCVRHAACPVLVTRLSPRPSTGAAAKGSHAASR
jgi:nucleotide-binding universal stress UspA family protein